MLFDLKEEWREEGGVLSLSSFEGFSSEVTLLVDPNPLCSCKWGWLGGWRGVNLDSHRFLVCSEGSEWLAARVNAERRSDLLLPSVLPTPSQDRILLSGVTRADPRPALLGLCWCP